MNDSFPYLHPGERITFPDPKKGSGDSPVCYGGNLSPGVLLSAYEQGLFPWFSPGDPIYWWSPEPRFILLPANLHISKRLQRYGRASGIILTVDRDFPQVIQQSKTTRQSTGTWITDDMQSAYISLYELGYAHSIEAWDENKFVGGLYGVHTGEIFSGESMVSLQPNASKFALTFLAQIARELNIAIIDAQMETPHIRALGGSFIPRDEYLVHTKANKPGETDASYPGVGWKKFIGEQFCVSELFSKN